jgi:hypothetical protein
MMPSLGAGRTRRFIHPSAWKMNSAKYICLWRERITTIQETAKVLYDLKSGLWNMGFSTPLYDEDLDHFRFKGLLGIPPTDFRFFFCQRQSKNVKHRNGIHGQDR